MIRPAGLFSVCGLLLTSVLRADAAPINAAPTVWHFKEPRPLRVWPGLVAIQRDASTNAASLPALTLDPDRQIPIPGWEIVRIEDATTTPATLARIAEISTRADVRYASPVFIGEESAGSGMMIVPPEVLVGFAEGVDDSAARAILSDAGLRVLEADFGNIPGAYRVRSDSLQGLDVLERTGALAVRDEVAWAEPDMIFEGRGDVTPTDPFYASCWGHSNTGQYSGTPGFDMDTDLAWNITQGSSSIIVVVIDTGVDQTHPDIRQRVGADFTSDGPAGNGGPVNACDNHGTAVAGCVSAPINALGTVGTAPGCTTASARAFISSTTCNGSWTSNASWTVNALSWATTIGARVTNNSNGYGFTSAAILTAYTNTRAAGMVHFASAGNDNSTAVSYPANIAPVAAIAALDSSGARASFSNFGPTIDFIAPGNNVVTTDRPGSSGWVGGDYVTAAGTSFASPYTAGVAALMLSINPAQSAANVESNIRDTCRDLGTAGKDDQFGWGLVNAYNAVRLAGCIVTITSQPSDRAVSSGDTASFSVVANAPAAISYAWRRNGTPLSNGLRPSGAFVTGATSPTMTITNLQPDDAGNYSCAVSMACGPTITRLALLSICPCPADFDNSGGTPDASDIDAFFASWLNGLPSADTDCSGGTPDAGDIDQFFSAWLAGGC